MAQEVFGFAHSDLDQTEPTPFWSNGHQLCGLTGASRIACTHDVCANMAYTYIGSGKPLRAWPIKFLRGYGQQEEIFSFEAGRNCPGGAGLFFFHVQVSL